MYKESFVRIDRKFWRNECAIAVRWWGQRQTLAGLVLRFGCSPEG